MASIRDIFVRLGVRTDPRGFDRATAGLNKIRRSAISLGSVLATGALAVGFKKMIELASDIQETSNKFGAVFGEAGSDVQKQLADIAKRTGATNLQLQTMASNIGALIKPSLGSAQAAGKLAAGVAELALDIASFNNVSAEDAIVALRSGLIGSAEPLQRFGVDTRIAALQLEAMRQGITGNIKDMTEGQRVTLRFAAIQRQLGAQGATGDATRTAEDFANASRNLGEAMKETAGIIGTFFLSSTGNVVNKMRELVDAFQLWLATNREFIQQRVDTFIDNAGRVIRNVVTFVRRAVNITKAWFSALGPVGKGLLKIGAIVAGLAILMLLPAGPILLLIGLIALIIDDFETWQEGGDSVIGDIVEGFKEMGDAIGVLRKRFDLWVRDHVVGVRAVTSLFGVLTVAIGIALVKANAAAVLSFLAHLPLASKK